VSEQHRIVLRPNRDECGHDPERIAAEAREDLLTKLRPHLIGALHGSDSWWPKYGTDSPEQLADRVLGRTDTRDT
jgi:hypothetical protein